MTSMAADWRGAEIDHAGGAAHIEKPTQRWGRDGIEPQLPSAIERATQDWIDTYGVNTAQLFCLGNERTRYGMIELGGHRFVVGPTPIPAEAQVLTRLLKARPQIGAIFCVEPGAMQGLADAGDPSREPRKAGYAERSISAYISSVIRQGRLDFDASGESMPRGPVKLDGGLSRVQFMEFIGMERFDAEIPREVLWHAGRGVAAYMRENPGKIALVCSEHGISRPCAVIASAALQLENGETNVRVGLGKRVVEQRSRLSDHHINLAARSLDLIAEFASLLDVLRNPGRGDLHQERKIHLLKARLPELAAGRYAGVDWAGDDARRALATLLEDNFARVSPALASGGLPPGMALLWLGDEFNVQRGVRFLTPSYLSGHIDRISQEEIDPNDQNAIRLVTVDDEGLTCDNKYYDAASVADWNRQCRRRSSVMSNPVSRAPVVALLVREAERARLERLFRGDAA
ncbi:hypothetical protein [Pandoraea horticolens]|nr:hypothetical protein [Pandoraea horticolens]